MKNVITILILLSVHDLFGQSEIRVRQYAQEYGKTLAATNGTSKAINVATDVVNAETENGQYIIELKTSWDDDLSTWFTSNYIKAYILGVLTVNLDGSNKKFAETSRSENLREVTKSIKRTNNWNGVVDLVIDFAGNKIIQSLNKEFAEQNISTQTPVKEYKPIEKTVNYEFHKMKSKNNFELLTGGDRSFARAKRKKYRCRGNYIQNAMAANVYLYQTYSMFDVINSDVNSLKNIEGGGKMDLNEIYEFQFIKIMTKTKGGYLTANYYYVTTSQSYIIQLDENNQYCLYAKTRDNWEPILKDYDCERNGTKFLQSEIGNVSITNTSGWYQEIYYNEFGDLDVEKNIELEKGETQDLKIYGKMKIQMTFYKIERENFRSLEIIGSLEKFLYPNKNYKIIHLGGGFFDVVEI